MNALWLAALLAGSVGAQEAATPTVADRLELALSRARAGRDDLDVRPARWDTRFIHRTLEGLLSDPLALPERSAEWGRALESARGLGGAAALAGSLLGVPTEPPRSAPAPAVEEGAALLPPPTGEMIAELALAVARARPFLNLANAGLSPRDRERLSEAMLKHLRYGRPERVDSSLFDLAARFDLSALLQAVRGVTEAADRLAWTLEEQSPFDATLPRTLRVAGSTVTIGGSGNDVFSEEETARSTLLLDFGGRNRYVGAPAAAGPGEIKIVIDLGSEVVIDSSGPVATGRFGIGLLYLPLGGGAKRLRGGPFSLGAGLFGAGLLKAKGDGSRLESGDFSQGAAAFGVGVLDAEGSGLAFSAPMAAQGFGFTRGAGLFRAKGQGAKLECGLVYPDPRDAAAALSLCQGVGYGPRAFAAGGYGLARVESDRADVESNYFAQGSGYWHGFGGFYLKGDDARVQSRRYGQGAGIHTALGALHVEGSRNRLLHWGVGPGFGWDWGSGYAEVRGDSNELYADWGSGKGDVNGHGLVWIDGSGNRAHLGEGGNGQLKRSAPSYGVVVVSGTANRWWLPGVSSASAMGEAFVPSLWGTVEADGDAVLDPKLSIEAPRWRELERERAEAARADREWNAARLAESDTLPARERLERWLFLAAEGGLDGRTPAEALARLLSLPDAEAALLPELVQPERFDEFIQLRVVLPAYGRRLAEALAKGLARSSGLRKALLLGFYRSLPAEEGVQASQGAARDRDQRVRREGLGLLGSLFDHQRGEEPGRLAFLEEVLALCKRAKPEEPLPREAIERIGQKRLGDLLAALALDPGATGGDRLELLAAAPDPFNPLPPAALNAFAKIWGRRPAACRQALERELKDAKRLEARARDRLVEAAGDGSPELLPVALASLGQLGWAKDAERLLAALSAEDAATREAAAAGLARMGGAGGKAVLAALESSTEPVRAMGVVAAAQSSDVEVFRLLSRGLADAEEAVRLAAIAGLFAAQIPNHHLRKEFVPALERLAAQDPSLPARNGAAYAAAAFR